jgi:hypothetical protein
MTTSYAGVHVIEITLGEGVVGGEREKYLLGYRGTCVEKVP